MRTCLPVVTSSDFPDSQRGQLLGPGSNTMQRNEIGPTATTDRFITITGTTDRTTFHYSTLKVKEKISQFIHCRLEETAVRTGKSGFNGLNHVDHIFTIIVCH